MAKTVSIEGMACAGCSGRIENLLSALPGVSATVSLEDKQAVINGEVEDDVIESTITDAGYKVVEITET